MPRIKELFFVNRRSKIKKMSQWQDGSHAATIKAKMRHEVTCEMVRRWHSCYVPKTSRSVEFLDRVRDTRLQRARSGTEALGRYHQNFFNLLALMLFLSVTSIFFFC